MTAFETQTCGRCGGGGQYSYNQRDGTRCWGCRGTGKQFTKKGAAARAYFNELSPVRAAKDLLPGDVFWDMSHWRKVSEPVVIDTLNAGYVKICCGPQYIFGCGAEQQLRLRASALETAIMLSDALAYQDSLTKAGNPRVVRQKKEAA